MPVEVIGIDHIYLAVSDLKKSETFYDPVLSRFGFRKKRNIMNDREHVHYYNRQYGFTIRPADPGTPPHNPFAPGLHHFCFRVEDHAAVDRAAADLRQAGIDVKGPKLYPEYDPDYYSLFFADPDGIILEITNFRERRRKRMSDWENAD